MTKYTDALTAEQLIQYIASAYIENSNEKVAEQRNHYIKICREWLEANKPKVVTVYELPVHGRHAKPERDS